MAEIAAGRLKEEMLQNFDLRTEAGKAGRRVYKAVGRSLDIPPLIKIALEEYLKGQARVHMELDATKEFSHLMRRLVHHGDETAASRDSRIGILRICARLRNLPVYFHTALADEK